MTCAILTIGTELTRGELRDKNGGYLASTLTDRGYEVTEMCTVNDDENHIVQTLTRLSRAHDFVVCTGGLGPTTDDKTTLCAAKSAGRPLVRHQEAFASLSRLMMSRGRTMTDASAKQADFPDTARILDNPYGTAPGFTVEIGGCAFFFMPGVPAEMERMFEAEVLPQLPPPPKRILCRRLRTFGLPEVEVNDRLVGVEESHDVIIGYRASHSEIEVKVIAEERTGESDHDLDRRVSHTIEVVRDRLGDAVYSEGSASLPEVVGRLLLLHEKTLCLAESCTGGLVSHLITSVPGASAYYLGGVCSYDNSVKSGLLGVTEEALVTHGAVSAVVARQMADGAKRALGTDFALSLTGIAGPDGGTDEKPVGLVHFGIASPTGTSTLHRVFHGTRTQIQRRAALFGLWQVRAALVTSAALNPEQSD